MSLLVFHAVTIRSAALAAAELAYARSMVSLKLARNAFTGLLPEDWDSEVLIEVDLSENQITGKDALMCIGHPQVCTHMWVGGWLCKGVMGGGRSFGQALDTTLVIIVCHAFMQAPSP